MAARKKRSKKRYGANFERRLHEPFTFLLDQCLGSQLVAEVVHKGGAKVELFEDNFAPDAPDEEWLPIAGERGWIVLGKDKQIRRRPHEVAALVKGGVRSFTLTGGNMTGKDMASAVENALPAMIQYVRDFPAPFVATISASGKVQMVLRSADLAYRAETKRKPKDK